MFRQFSNLLFSISIGSAFLLRFIRLPDALIGFVVACMIVGAILAHLMPIRTTGMALAIGGLILVFHSTPDPSITMTGLFVFLAVLQIAATALLISADLSAAKEKQTLGL